jgi:hypothetical protein
METLKACPFCGLNLMDVHTPHNDESSITCSDAESCVSVSALGSKNLFRVWNHRPIEDSLREEVKRLRGALEEIAEEGCDCAALDYFDLVCVCPSSTASKALTPTQSGEKGE